jgi:hypothetical protein
MKVKLSEKKYPPSSEKSLIIRLNSAADNRSGWIAAVCAKEAAIALIRNAVNNTA